jgi:uncharacterized lipoprotein
MKTHASWSLPVVLFASALLAAGCAAKRREAYLQDKTREHVYSKPLNDVWPQARMLLKEKGFSLRETPGSYEIATEWLQTSPPSTLGTSFTRYLVRGKQPSAESSTVEFLRQNRVEAGAGAVHSGTGERQAGSGTNTTNLERDLEMEWELLQRVDPEGAKALTTEAEQKFK